MRSIGQVKEATLGVPGGSRFGLGGSRARGSGVWGCRGPFELLTCGGRLNRINRRSGRWIDRFIKDNKTVFLCLINRLHWLPWLFCFAFGSWKHDMSARRTIVSRMTGNGCPAPPPSRDSTQPRHPTHRHDPPSIDFHALHVFLGIDSGHGSIGCRSRSASIRVRMDHTFPRL